MPEIHPVHFTRHGKSHFIGPKSWAFTGQQGMAPLLCSEFVHAARHFPIVFGVQNPETQQIGAFALLGITPKVNLQVDAQGQWQSGYIPAVFRRYPFLLVKADAQKDEMVLCIDESGGHLAESGGQRLFDDDGKQTPLLEKILAFANACQQQVPVGEKFCRLLTDLNLVDPLELKIRAQQTEQQVNIKGLLRVDEKKLAALDDADFLRLRHFGALPLVYAHLFSLGQIEYLAKMMRKGAGLPATDLKDSLPNSFAI